MRVTRATGKVAFRKAGSTRSHRGSRCSRTSTNSSPGAAVLSSNRMMFWSEVRPWTRPGDGQPDLSPYPILLWLMDSSSPNLNSQLPTSNAQLPIGRRTFVGNWELGGLVVGSWALGIQQGTSEGRALLNRDELDIEDEHPLRVALALVSELLGNPEAHALAFGHHRHALAPALDHFVQPH